MEEKPGKAKIAVLAAVVLVSSGLMAWALFSAFQSDSARFGDYNDDYYAGDEDTTPEDDNLEDVATDTGTPKEVVPAESAQKSQKAAKKVPAPQKAAKP